MKKSDWIDQVIKEKLGQLQVTPPPDAWQQFEEQLNALEADTPEVSNDWLDEVVFEKMHRWEKPVASRWDIMSARLDAEAAARRLMIRNRLMEVALVLMILFTFVEYFGDQTPIRMLQNISFANYSNAPRGMIPAFKNHDDNHRYSAETNIAGTPAALAALSTLAARDERENLEVMPRRYKPTPLLPASPQKPQKSMDKPTGIDNPLALKPALEIPAAAEREELMAALDRIMLNELSAEESTDYPRLILPMQPRSGVYVSMFGSVDYNRIVTPAAMTEDGQVIDPGFERYAKGYSGGILFSWEKGRWEIGTGAIYTAKEYQPRPLVYLVGSLAGGYYGESFKLVELNMLQVPLQVRYNFIKKNKWRAFATLSASAHVALQANYYLSEDIRSERLPSPLPSTRADKKAKILSRGWLDGGSLMESAYLTGNAGVGLEYFITERCGLFTQPTFHYSISHFNKKGFGPDYDRIHTMSLFTGVRVKL